MAPLPFPEDAWSSLLLVERLAALAAVQGTVQLLALRAQFSRRGLLSWEALRSCRSVTSQGPAAPLLDCLCGESGFGATLGVRLTAALALLIVPTHTELEVVLVVLLAATTALLIVRMPYGVDGSDQMSMLLCGGLFFWVLGGRTPLMTEACLWFLAGQSCLAYLGAGLSKLRAPVWRSGEAITRIVNTRLWGHAGLARALRSYPGLCPALAWATFLPECLFPLVLLSGRPGCYLFLLWGVLFHLSIAWMMGLNTFLWTFLATYPAIAYVAGRVQGWLGG